MRVEQVPELVTRRLRNAVLRPGLPVDAVHWPGLDAPEAATFAVLADDDRPLATVTVRPEPCPWRPEVDGAWRLRGMATEPGHRGEGLGRLALDAAVRHVADVGAPLVWCNVRDVARSFYDRTGFVVEGAGFVNEAGIPHHPMALELGPGRSAG